MREDAGIEEIIRDASQNKMRGVCKGDERWRLRRDEKTVTDKQ